MQVSKVVRKYGFTLDDVANKLGYKCASSLRATLSKKNGVPASPTLTTLRAIADAIGCSVGEFFDDERTNLQKDWDGTQPKIDIRSVMHKQGVTQADMVIRLGVTERQLKNILVAKTPNLATLYKVARALNVPITALFSYE